VGAAWSANVERWRIVTIGCAWVPRGMSRSRAVGHGHRLAMVGRWPGVVWGGKSSDLTEIRVLCDRLGQNRWPFCSVNLIVAATVSPPFSRHHGDDNGRIEMITVELR
jgi:hypothetical protein